MPRLRRLTGEAEIVGPVKISPADLYHHARLAQPGIVLVGDAFATSCPAAGTGTNKVFTDVERLCNVHVPRWLATEGMSVDKIAAFYDDPVKRACDQHSHRQGVHSALGVDRGGTAMAGPAAEPVPRPVGLGKCARRMLAFGGHRRCTDVRDCRRSLDLADPWCHAVGVPAPGGRR